MNKKLMGLGLAIVAGCFIVAQVQADEEELNYAYGQVIQVSDGQIVLTEINLDEQPVQSTYTSNDQTVYENVDSLANIAVNDNIEIFYRVDGDTKIAVSVIKEEEDTGADYGAEAWEDESGMPSAPAANAEQPMVGSAQQPTMPSEPAAVPANAAMQTY
ncbi:MAG: hypothetical protein Q7S13_03955 [Candidatus Omnitrophota bacterium]|nr:hypothetical protein [Candidatus Omnitrophota bacterium]